MQGTIKNNIIEIYLATWNILSFPSRVRHIRIKYGESSFSSTPSWTLTFPQRETLSMQSPMIKLSLPLSETRSIKQMSITLEYRKSTISIN